MPQSEETEKEEEDRAYNDLLMFLRTPEETTWATKTNRLPYLGRIFLTSITDRVWERFFRELFWIWTDDYLFENEVDFFIRSMKEPWFFKVFGRSLPYFLHTMRWGECIGSWNLECFDFYLSILLPNQETNYWLFPKCRRERESWQEWMWFKNDVAFHHDERDF